MSTDEPMPDIAAVWDGIERWDAHNAPSALAELGTPATRDELLALERATGIALPPDLRASLSRHNGSGRVQGLDHLDTAWAAKVWERMEMRQSRGDFVDLFPADATGKRFAAVWWHPKWLPVAEHRAGTLVCVDTGPGPEGRSGQILQLELDDEGPAATQWQSFAHWLEAYRRDLEAGKYQVDPDGNLDRIAE